VSWAQNTSSARSGSATFAGHTLQISQDAGQPTCTNFSLSFTSANPNSAAGSHLTAIYGSPDGCRGRSWTASGNGSWITVSATSGSGPSGTHPVTVSWTQNTSTSPRSGTATIAGNTFTVDQGPGDP